MQQAGKIRQHRPQGIGENMNYQELMKKQSDEFNKFEGIFFAFNNKQFTAGMIKIGLQPTETNKIYSIPGGGYIAKDKSKEFKEMNARLNAELKAFKKETKKLIDAIVYELGNHEYGYTYDVEPALEALGLTRETVDKTVLKKAIKIYRDKEEGTV